jgi:hypothetical protein
MHTPAALLRDPSWLPAMLLGLAEEDGLGEGEAGDADEGDEGEEAAEGGGVSDGIGDMTLLQLAKVCVCVRSVVAACSMGALRAMLGARALQHCCRCDRHLQLRPHATTLPPHTHGCTHAHARPQAAADGSLTAQQTDALLDWAADADMPLLFDEAAQQILWPGSEEYQAWAAEDPGEAEVDQQVCAVVLVCMRGVVARVVVVVVVVVC